MIAIAAIEDNEEDYLILENALSCFFKDIKESYTLRHFTDASSFLDSYDFDYNLVFMDIDLPDLNGVQAAKTLRLKDQNVAIVFLTNLSHYAINGYEVNALDYILKPVNTYTVALKMPKILHYMAVNNEKQISITTKNMILLVYVSEIFYVEVIKHELIYHTRKGNFNTRSTMKEASALLEPMQFVKCNNCYLVNLRYVTGVKDNFVLIYGESLIISRNKKTEFINRLTDYIGGKL